MENFLKKESSKDIANLSTQKQVIIPIGTYAAKTKSDTCKTKLFLETLKMKDLKSVSSKILRDHLNNEEIRKDLNVEQISRGVYNFKTE